MLVLGLDIFTKRITDMNNLEYEQRLPKPQGLHRRARGDMTETFKNMLLLF